MMGAEWRDEEDIGLGSWGWDWKTSLDGSLSVNSCGLRSLGGTLQA